MEEKKSKKGNKKIIIISIIGIMLVIMGFFILKNLVGINTKEENNYVRNENVLFEGVGHYGIAYVGCNNADRGTAADVNVKLITSYPSNWNNIKKNIPNNILSRVNNMSGSRLNFSGTIKKAWLTCAIYGLTTNYADFLIIKPDGSYEVKRCTNTIEEINIVQSGWYYISILDVPIQPQQAWSITAIYENDTLPMKYMSINSAIYDIAGTERENYRDIMSINFTGPFSTAFNGVFEVYGVTAGAGAAAWPISGRTEDKLEIVFSDGTYKQVYQDTYNGKTIFAGRTSTDFFNGTLNTVKSHNIKGGELDIFYEKIGNDYFGGKIIEGYRITKIGINGLSTILYGLTREMAYPNMSIKSTITNQIKNELVENEKVHIKVDITNNSTNENRPAYKSTITCKLDNALSNAENLIVKVNGVNSNLVPVYNSTTNEVVINNISKISPGQIVTIEYDATINSNIQNKGEVNSNIELPIDVSVKVYSVDIETLNSSSLSSKGKYDNSYNETKGTINVTGIYKAQSGGIEVKYIDEITNEEIANKEEKTGLQGDGYTTEAKEISGYELVETPTNASGTMQEEKITVTYKYRKLSKVIVKYVDIISNNEIDKDEVEYKEGDNYTIEAKEITGYRIVETPENVNGTMGRENIEVVLGYKKISGGVEIKYIDEVTGEEIEAKETIEGLEKDRYETEAKEIEGYELVNTPANKIGEMTVDKITVEYKYRKLSKVTVEYIDMNNNTEIERIEQNYKEGDSYRAESKEINGYKLIESPTNANGVVGREDIEVIYGYKKIAGGIEVRYIDEVTKEEIATSEHYVGLEKDRYETESKEIEGYELTVTPTNKTGEMTVEKITVTYEYRKQSKVTVKYIDLNNNTEIEKEEKTYKEGDNYTTQSKEINNYKLVETPENGNGTMRREDIEVIYGYKKIAGGVESKYIDESTGEEIDVRETKNGLEKDKYETEAKEIEGYELVNIPTNKTGEMTVDKITVTYKYRKLSKVTVKYIDLNNNTELDKEEKTYKEGDNYRAESKEINGYKLVETPKNANGVVEREDIEVVYGYKKIAGGVIVKHIEKEANVVIEEEKIEGLVGEKYSTRKLDLEKYNYIEVVGNIEGELSEESIEVSYYYEKKQAIVEIIYEDENGKEIYKEILEGKVGDKYKVEVKNIENYKIIEEPTNIEGKYTVDEIVVKFIVERIKSKVTINIVDDNGKIIEVIEKEGYIGDKEEISLPEIDGYYPEEKSIFIEYGESNNISVVYKKKLLDLPNTSDINIYVYIVIFIISIIIICMLIIRRTKARKNM